ncbi:LD-carboxypeptidase [Viridibacillus sp. YIM B01967]|uniref:LD-carboxypeptidase n=1 Tax=Viridibacillus soli TaxID=2798301 RepID=A0ABS1HC01_9BACL|nr:LD-carboxypeptidase [Viridibacillus soli]MBK3496981.1 LD-carboxypeptidase [Viridibacillus soli]
MKIRPKRLQVGDTVGIIAPASPPNIENLTKSFAFLEELGLKYVIGKSVQLKNGYLAGTDEERLADLHDMIEDPSIAAIICASGGYGAARIADRIDYQLLEENPKIFWGFSDITFLHTALGLYSDIVTFHGPTLSSMGREDVAERTKRMFKQLFEPAEIHYGEDISSLTTMSGGAVRGELTGGNLSLIARSIGTKYEIDTKGKILLIEDIGLEPAHIDGLLNQLKQSRKLDEAAGIIVGEFTNAEPNEYKDSLTLDEVLDHYLGGLGKPVVKGFKIGHCEPNVAIPLGVDAILDADRKHLAILPGVQ